MRLKVISFFGIVILSLLSVIVGTNVLHFDTLTISVFLLFATWAAFMASVAGYWPFSKVKQPGKGLIVVVFTFIYAAFHMLTQETIFGFPKVYYWPFIANLFLGLGLTAIFDYKLTSELKQPLAIIVNILVWYLLSVALFVVVPVLNGMVPAIWFAWFVYYFFWLERWPIAELPQPRKGIITMFILAGLGGLLAYIFVWIFNTSFFKPDAGTWFAQWVWWLVFTSWVLGQWPFQALKQPAKGLVGLLVTVVLASITYFVTSNIWPDLNYLLGASWIFVCWVYIWPICWPAGSK